MNTLEDRQIAVSKGITLDDAQKLISKFPGKVYYWVYHHCEDAPICSAEHNDRIPRSLWNEDEDCYECTECQEGILLGELTFSTPFKVVSDEDARAVRKMDRAEILELIAA